MNIYPSLPHNYQVLANLQSGQKLIVNALGLLETIEQPLKDPEKKIELLIAQVCKQKFKEVVTKHIPLSMDSMAFKKECVDLTKFIERAQPFATTSYLKKRLRKLMRIIQAPDCLEAELALKEKIDPLPLNKTSSGTYLLYNRLRHECGIFKPKAQELGKSQNPSWLIWLFRADSKTWGIEPGTSYLRERAAYLLDKKHFSNVPFTTQCVLSHPLFDTSFLGHTLGIWRRKPNLVGSFQVFRRGCKPGQEAISASDLYIKPKSRWIRNIFQNIWKVRTFAKHLFFNHVDIHRLAILDIRLLNGDRHFANFLVDRRCKIHPIDHGLVLPKKALQLRFDWRHLATAHTPFSGEELMYIEELDPEEDGRLLKKLGIEDQAIERMKIATYLLKACAVNNLTPYEIADLMAPLEKEQVKDFEPGKPSFENEICKKILEDGEDLHLTIAQAVNAYRQKNPRKNSLRTLFSCV